MEFSKGDRVVKMSGTAAGRYGTVNNVREDGTLNVVFDGDKIPRFCDPDRCGKVAAANAAGDQVIKRVGRYSLVYNELNGGYWMYIGSNGELLTDFRGNAFNGRGARAAAVEEFDRLVSTAR